MKSFRTPITYYGGKQSMLKHILPSIPTHKIYCEPFFGGGAVFFAKEPSYLEVINDVDDRLINFYHSLKHNFDELNQLISNTLHCESEYYRAKDIHNGRIRSSQLEQAWAIWVITNMSFSGSMHGGWKWCNGTAGSHTGRFISKKAQHFELLKERLQAVQISCRDALEVINQRDTKETFFYLDPPYPGSIQGHYRGYSFNEFSKLLELLATIKGKFLLSNFWSQTLKYHILKNGWEFEKHTMQMKVANFHGARYKDEILVRNFELNLTPEDYLEEKMKLKI